jgi:hypothetical protein
MYSPYDTYIFIRLANKYESGKVRKTRFSKNNVEIRKLRSESRCLAEAWRRVEEKLVSEPMTADQVRAYRAKTGRSRARMKTATPRELKRRMQNWYAT